LRFRDRRDRVAPTQPLVANDAFAALEDTPLSDSVAGNDTLSGNGGNVYSVAADPGSGTLALAADGSFIYMPAPDFHGADAFDYRLCDIGADCATATVALTVDPADDPVAALDDGFDHGSMLFTGSVAGNDGAPDGGATWTLLAQTAAGTLDFRADGSFDYTPAVGNPAPMTFTYRLCDVDDDCDEASVALVPLPPAIFADGLEN
jgi:hypothetical protein